MFARFSTIYTIQKTGKNIHEGVWEMIPTAQRTTIDKLR